MIPGSTVRICGSDGEEKKIASGDIGRDREGKEKKMEERKK